ncbi:unnamed protein product [Parajaminaea phylloscopi]
MSTEEGAASKSERRRRQVREAQARFRDRKDREVEELRYHVESLSIQVHRLQVENAQLRASLGHSPLQRPVPNPLTPFPAVSAPGQTSLPALQPVPMHSLSQPSRDFGGVKQDNKPDTSLLQLAPTVFGASSHPNDGASMLDVASSSSAVSENPWEQRSMLSAEAGPSRFRALLDSTPGPKSEGALTPSIMAHSLDSVSPPNAFGQRIDGYQEREVRSAPGWPSTPDRGKAKSPYRTGDGDPPQLSGIPMGELNLPVSWQDASRRFLTPTPQHPQDRQELYHHAHQHIDRFQNQQPQTKQESHQHQHLQSQQPPNLAQQQQQQQQQQLHHPSAPMHVSRSRSPRRSAEQQDYLGRAYSALSDGSRTEAQTSLLPHTGVSDSTLPRPRLSPPLFWGPNGPRRDGAG